LKDPANFFEIALWGNKADLSLFYSSEKTDNVSITNYLQQLKPFILSDNASQLTLLLHSSQGKSKFQIDYGTYQSSFVQYIDHDFNPWS